ncbi:hypothetical protein [Coxiella endosymbiont of Amblyomma nuttalli]|uniref:hypothetical protein n=1 Tax=Coxiella endosymbiont of Amblyomma nuttalli TaxID=2749996 RepID=UPI001BA71598|nr:hypothetical protein [Coxiella endosymbiont of Amblyomma nuttalli]QTS83725.1 hypothetical protein CEAn_00182 [Coxiella endosymbiont of Amblyomma nuttalli]
MDSWQFDCDKDYAHGLNNFTDQLSSAVILLKQSAMINGVHRMLSIALGVLQNNLETDWSKTESATAKYCVKVVGFYLFSRHYLVIITVICWLHESLFVEINQPYDLFLRVSRWIISR